MEKKTWALWLSTRWSSLFVCANLEHQPYRDLPKRVAWLCPLIHRDSRQWCSFFRNSPHDFLCAFGILHAHQKNSSESGTERSRNQTRFKVEAAKTAAAKLGDDHVTEKWPPVAKKSHLVGAYPIFQIQEVIFRHIDNVDPCTFNSLAEVLIVLDMRLIFQGLLNSVVVWIGAHWGMADLQVFHGDGLTT